MYPSDLTKISLEVDFRRLAMDPLSYRVELSNNTQFTSVLHTVNVSGTSQFITCGGQDCVILMDGAQFTPPYSAIRSDLHDN